jgi:hypothetical protein
MVAMENPWSLLTRNDHLCPYSLFMCMRVYTGIILRHVVFPSLSSSPRATIRCLARPGRLSSYIPTARSSSPQDPPSARCSIQVVMSDRNSSPFKDALRRSKSFLTNIKIAPAKPKLRSSDNYSIATSNDRVSIPVSITNPTGNNPNYKRRMRVVTDTERREHPLSLGEGGWGTQSWGHTKQDQKQQEELEELWSEMGRASASCASGAASQCERVTDPRVFLGHERAQRESQSSAQSRDSRGSARARDSRQASGGSPAQYNRPLPFRVSGPRDPPEPMPPHPTRASGAGASPPARVRVSGPYLSTESAADLEARLAARSAPKNPLRTRVAGPRPNVSERRGSYTARGTRVTPGSFDDNEREEYLARIRGSDGSEGSRAGDGTRKGAGATLF